MSATPTSEPTSPPITINQLNNMAAAEFIATLGGIYEHSPWVAEAVIGCRPFEDHSALQQAMQQAVDDSSDEQKLALLKSHPEFAGKAATEGTLTQSSTSEQSRLSLNNLPPQQHRRMQEFNRQFMQRFGFPGIVAVRLNKSVEQIFDQFESRLQNEFETEVQQALQQVHSIAAFRLGDLLSETS